MSTIRKLPRDFYFDDVIIIKKPGDFNVPLRSDAAYVVDGTVDMSGSPSIDVPSGGLTIVGWGLEVSGIVRTDTTTPLFASETAGNLFMDGLFLTASGTSSKVFDLVNDGSGAVELNNVNITNSTSIGELDNYRQMLCRNVGFFSLADGLTFSNSWNGLAVVDTIVRGMAVGSTLFKEGTSLSFSGSVRSNINALNLDTSVKLFDFSESNIVEDGEFILNNVRTNVDNATPNISPSSVKSNFSNCLGINNTYPGAVWSIDTDVATVISTADTLVKMAGGTTYTNLAWMSGDVDNAVKSETDVELDVDIRGILSFGGTSNDIIGVQIRLWDDSASAYTNVGSEFIATLNPGNRAENISFSAVTIMSNNDRIEVWIKNVAATNDITGLVGGSVSVSRRPS